MDKIVNLKRCRRVMSGTEKEKHAGQHRMAFDRPKAGRRWPERSYRPLVRPMKGGRWPEDERLRA